VGKEPLLLVLLFYKSSDNAVLPPEHEVIAL